MPKPNSSFTVKSNSGLLRMLISVINVHVPGNQNSVTLNAIWDTGATNSSITKKVSQQLGLINTGFAIVNTANGPVRQKTFTVDIGLPNNLIIQGVVVTEISALTSGCDALIGMDIITLGDFSITNHKGNTCMSFRFPSCHEIDYVANPSFGITTIRNIPSGKPGSNFIPHKKKRK